MDFFLWVDEFLCLWLDAKYNVISFLFSGAQHLLKDCLQERPSHRAKNDQRPVVLARSLITKYFHLIFFFSAPISHLLWQFCQRKLPVLFHIRCIPFFLKWCRRSLTRTQSILLFAEELEMAGDISWQCSKSTAYTNVSPCFLSSSEFKPRIVRNDMHCSQLPLVHFAHHLQLSASFLFVLFFPPTVEVATRCCSLGGECGSSKAHWFQLWQFQFCLIFLLLVFVVRWWKWRLWPWFWIWEQQQKVILFAFDCVQ